MKIVVLNNFAIGQTHLGKSVFAGKFFKKGDVITQFTGKILDKTEIPKTYKGEDDRFVQVGLDKFMGPSGGVDDLINHSCDPNTGLRFGRIGLILLIAIRDIEAGEEITWDYSTTMFENNWRMKCDCRSPICRGIVQDFTLLDRSIQDKYRELDVIPQYIKDYMDSEEYHVYTKGIERLSKHGNRAK